MDKGIQALEALVESMERILEEALQTEGEPQISYRLGVIRGIRRAIYVLENLEED